MYDQVKVLLILTLILPVSMDISVAGQADICSKPPDSGVCYMLFMAWYFDVKVQECREYVYGGCGGNENRFATEDDCYAKCGGNLIELHPPTNVTVAITRVEDVYLYWYRPLNFKLHALNESTDSGFRDKFFPDATFNYSETDAGKGSGVTHALLQTKGVATPKSVDTNKNNESSTAHDSKTTISTADGAAYINNSDSKTNGSGVTPSVPAQVAENQTSVGVNKTENTTDGSAVTKKNNQTAVQQTTQSGEGKTTAKPVLTTNPVEDNTIAWSNLSISHYIGKKRVPYHFADFTSLQHYIISYKMVTASAWTNITVAGNLTEYDLTGLQSDTNYNLFISAVYLTNSSIPSSLVTFKTRRDPSQATNCYCDPFGTKGGYKSCNLSLSQMPWCPCRNGWAGLFCEICARDHYRTASSLPCHNCPCSKISSSGSCHFVTISLQLTLCQVESYLRCTSCKDEYTGNLCHRCSNGYYRDYNSNPSVCRKCEGCHDIRPGLICDPLSGACLNCHYNTTGHSCDKCLSGFVGDPLKNIACLPQGDAGVGNHSSGEQQGYKPPPEGVIAAIVVGTIVLISGVVGIVIYRRIQNSPTNRPFWTIELQDDHEGVNFSSVPEDELERNHDDMNFYEKQQRNQTKSQPYSRLDEDM